MTFVEPDGATPLDPDEAQGLKLRHVTTRTDKNIGVDPFSIGTALRSMLLDARSWSEHDVYAPLEAAARFHHRMVQIHPFVNGNGRHARIAADVLLDTVYRHPPVGWASGFDLQADSERRVVYIAALRAADRGDLEPLLRFVGAIT